jgi:hypothetical protein
MKNFCVVCILVLLSASGVSAQDSAITPLSVMGVVTELNTETRQVVVTTAAGNSVTVTLSDRTVYMRIPPGEKVKEKFIKITAADFAKGDSVFARGRISQDLKSMTALEFYVMSQGDIAQKREREQADWKARGIVGTVTNLNAETKEISIDSRTPEGPKPVVIAVVQATKFRRYAPDSVRFADAKESTFNELKVGDQLRAVGTKSADGARFTPDELVSGSFQTIGGAITEVNNNELKITDSQSKQVVTVVLTKDATMKRITPEVLASLLPAKSGTAAPKPAADLQETFDQLPTLTIQELKAGDSIVVSSTKGAEPTRVTAIALLSGVGPLLQNNLGAKAISLGSMNLGGP